MTTTSSLMWEKNSRSVFIKKKKKKIEKINSIKRKGRPYAAVLLYVGREKMKTGYSEHHMKHKKQKTVA